ncbi:shikimate dehydrogenase [Jeotgalibacillus sp. S-D1]|uniref:shikimate dehydrogenase n=1 Tax=Jeotgalibacillus sp. S-D1 TaxID=2552189 RepID=UPI00105AADB2|nr:shikimate dehydrogenase [Jeotgalibacillus sp. S-D1]TDL34474.1 shikimate dehydrogenase [Jeotgalibacillus sp. S-D1]
MAYLLGVIGNPISQSKSPLMHNKWLAEEGLDGYYQAFAIELEKLEEAIVGMRALGIDGWNVTIPFKEAIMPFLDELDPAAKAIGAVNTVVRNGDKLIGRNTDGLGFVHSLLEKRSADQLNQASVLIIGAGGAAKGIYYALAQYHPEKIVVTNRTQQRAEALVCSISVPSPGFTLTIHEAQERLHEFDIIINTTSVGMIPNIKDMPLDITNISKNALAADIIYNPLETSFLHDARLNGADTLNGVGMFVHQGALAFSYWTGKHPNTEQAIKTIIQDQGGTIC